MMPDGIDFSLFLSKSVDHSFFFYGIDFSLFLFQANPGGHAAVCRRECGQVHQGAQPLQHTDSVSGSGHLPQDAAG